ncbi:F0F1 ATP synthase subunit delta [Cellulomonas denverensis]|uniref:ATP synthase subunit delta n=1 Tax=Cellulomonas denverensis TaxID=264297 RepID=A0A7X6KXL1_9CELL|nr:F0F1 ATP synthase subunit delta [Cellulomonas denverensis]NKY24063.1 F0F1 ATP synthase subunit delta [Cellulomonas denverensis]GIG26526.1 ATP synthase subunit delta [Cellulomonas denverensis]
MRAASQASLTAAAERFETLWQQVGAEAAALGEQVLAFADVVRGSGQLRRALTDPAAPGEAKAALVAGVLGSSADERVVDLLGGVVRSRWSHESDLPAALERLGHQAVLAGAEAEGVLDTVEEDLFRTQRFLVAERDVREALATRNTSQQARQELIRQLFGPVVNPRTLTLLERIPYQSETVGSVSAVSALADAAAERRSRTVAVVTSATALTREQEDRLRSGLARAYGRQVQLNVTVDPAVLGGMRVQVGPDVIDGTVSARVADARRRLAG